MFSAGEADEMLKLVTWEMRAFFGFRIAPVVQFHVAAAVFPLNCLNVPSLLSGIHSQNGHLFFKSHRVLGPCFLDLRICQKKFARNREAPSCLICDFVVDRQPVQPGVSEIVVLLSCLHDALYYYDTESPIVFLLKLNCVFRS